MAVLCEGSLPDSLARSHHDTATPADARGSSGPQLLAEDAGRLHPARGSVRRALREVTGPAREGRDPELSGAAGGSKTGLLDLVQSDRLRTALLLPSDAGTGRHRPEHPLSPHAEEVAHGVECRGGGSAAGRGGEREAPGGSEHDLRDGAAAFGSARPEGHRHRQRPHGDHGAPGQGAEGPDRHALAPAARGVAPLRATSTRATGSFPGAVPASRCMRRQSSGRV